MIKQATIIFDDNAIIINEQYIEAKSLLKKLDQNIHAVQIKNDQASIEYKDNRPNKTTGVEDFKTIIEKALRLAQEEHQEEITWDTIRMKRDQKIKDIRWRIERNQDEVALNHQPTEDITPIILYIQTLRDITTTFKTPQAVVFPELAKRRK